MKRAVLGVRMLALALVVSCAGCTLQGETTPTPTPAATPTPSPVATTTATPVATPTPEPTTAYTTYTDAANGFSVEYPADWSAQSLPGTPLAVTSPDLCGGQHPTFTLSKPGLETFFSSLICGTFLSSDRSFVSAEKMGVAGRAAIKWVTTADSGGAVPYLDTSYYVLSDTAAWVLSFTVIYTCRNEYQDAFDHMVGSFQFLS
jgi:hypothetical protein